MPTLDWIGKKKVINHHLDVPYRILQPIEHFNTDTESQNKIIKGDNLAALKSLLPEYEGKVKCIYIDPPYNTGNEKWVYNDNVNSPKIKKWLGEVVGKDGEDLTRHDKWLCMMYPRLKLLHRLLAEDGAIFISIDDNEQAHLKLICDEIFGKNRFMGTFVWKRRSSSQLSKNNVSIDHEYLFCYSKTNYLALRGVDKDYASYSNPNNDPNGPWVLGDLTVGMTKEQRPNQYYDLHDPKTGKIYTPNASRVWSYVPDTMEQKIKSNRIHFPQDTSKRPMLKRYLADLKSTINPISTWALGKKEKTSQQGSLFLRSELNSAGTKTIQKVFGTKEFDYAKPVSLLKSIIFQITDKDSIILDSFAGSGTTAHAVLNLNKEDGGNRKSTLVEMEDYADTITAERVRRVIKGYGKDKKAVAGTGGDFTYYELGDAMFIDNELLNENLPLEEIRRYVYYTETGSVTTYQPRNDDQHQYILGHHHLTDYYFYYEKEAITTLDTHFLNTITAQSDSYVIYADVCALSSELMLRYNIVFKKIPRDISRL